MRPIVSGAQHLSPSIFLSLRLLYTGKSRRLAAMYALGEGQVKRAKQGRGTYFRAVARKSFQPEVKGRFRKVAQMKFTE